MLNKILNNLKSKNEYNCYEINGRTYTNKELYKYVCNIYDYLLNKCDKKDKVIVYGHKDIYMIASFLACSFAGITYIPVDISIPEERKRRIILEVNPKIIIDDSISNIMNNDSYNDINEICMEDESIYYIIFTSGSTGIPKGVKITYSNIKSCMEWLTSICKVKGEVVLNQANFSFDLSVADIYLSLLTKSKQYIIERSVQKDYISLFNELKKSNASFAVMTPSYAELLLIDKSFNSILMPNLKKILFCGEKLSQSTVVRLKERFNNIKIINSYGPTECTFAVTSVEVKKDDEIPIGIPKSDTSVYLVDEKLNVVKDGEEGEILIAGKSVGDGYLNPKLNKKIFITFNNMKAYLTGDLAIKRNGNIYYIGRKDKQVKYKGYRVELLEVEKVINNLEYVEKSVVTVKKDKREVVLNIIAFIKLKEKNIVNAKEIKNILRKELPDYMIPVIKIVDNIPLNENGKVNERELLKETL